METSASKSELDLALERKKIRGQGETVAEDQAQAARRTKDHRSGEVSRIVIALVVPVVACGLQWLLWPTIQPFVWFLFYPAVFCSSWISGVKGGLPATILSAVLVVYFFIPPPLSFHIASTNTLFSVAVFVIMGVLLSVLNERLHRANQQTDEAFDTVRKANEQLRVANAEITRLYEQTRQVDQLKSQFFAQVSHELRTPLTLILGPLAKQLSGFGLPVETREDLLVVNRNARLLLRHVNDLLDAAKLDAGRMAVFYSEIDAARLVRFAASHFEALARDRGIKFTLVVPDRAVIQADAEKYQRIILNLLSNAFKFAPDGGAITLGLRLENEQAVIWVQDNGPGVPEAMREVVFERFQQGDEGRASRYGGTGLGLAIIKEFAVLHHGWAQVTEAPGGGALFTVTLPITAPDGAVIRPEPERMSADPVCQIVSELGGAAVEVVARRPVAGLNAPLVLVVGDNPELLHFIVQTLDRDYRVITAQNGEEALARVKASKPVLVVSDLMMPRMNGEQLLRALRDRPETAELPVLILTARADDACRIALLQAGAQDCLHKPFAAEELTARVGNLVAGRQLVEGALLEGEQRYRSLFENMLNGYAYCQMLYENGVPNDFIYLEVNPAFERLTGLKHVIGRKVSEVIPGLLQANPEVFEIYGRVAQSGTPEHFDTYLGSLDIWFSVAVYSPDKDYFVATFDNVTERKKAEKEILELNAGLEHRVRERTAEWEAANKELEAFSYSVSHDLRAPLRGIDGFSRALLEKYGPSLGNDGLAYLNRVLAAAQRMSGLIDDLLTLSRVTRSDMVRESVDVSALAREIVEDLRLREPSRQVEVMIADQILFNGDRRLLRTVMENLLGNAWKFTSKKSDARIEVLQETDPEKGRSCVIADNGAGFDMNYAGKLFGAFQRLHGMAEFTGTGVGLATVQRVIHRHGGRVWALGKVNEGARFFFSIPD